MKALKADPEHNLGNRTVTEAESARLAEFGFSKDFNLSETLPWRSYKLKVSRKNGTVQMNIVTNAFRHSPCQSAKATHFTVGLLALVVDFEAPQWVAETAVFSRYMSLSQEDAANIGLHTKLEIPDGSTVLVGVALEYFTDADGAICHLSAGSGNVVEIVEVY
jgi:hypothetical protein